MDSIVVEIVVEEIESAYHLLVARTLGAALARLGERVYHILDQIVQIRQCTVPVQEIAVEQRMQRASARGIGRVVAQIEALVLGIVPDGVVTADVTEGIEQRLRHCQIVIGSASERMVEQQRILHRRERLDDIRRILHGSGYDRFEQFEAVLPLGELLQRHLGLHAAAYEVGHNGMIILQKTLYRPLRRAEIIGRGARAGTQKRVDEIAVRLGRGLISGNYVGQRTVVDILMQQILADETRNGRIPAAVGQSGSPAEPVAQQHEAHIYILHLLDARIEGEMICEISRIGLPENASYIGNLRKVEMIYQIDILHKTLSSPVCVFFFR